MFSENCYLQEDTVVKKTALILAVILILLLLTGCGKKEFVPDFEKAIGIIIVNDQETIEQNGKIYANFADHQYLFDLDASVVYFFDYDSETSYAGDQNVTGITFGANIDSNTVGAEATVAYIEDETSANTISAYYLYYDGEGVYFEPDKSFLSASVNGTLVIEGDDYKSKITISISVPTEYFVITCFDEKGEVQSEKIRPEDFSDYSKYPLPLGTYSVEIASYDAAGEIIEQKTYHQGDRNYVVAYDIGGQIMGAKTLYLVWPE
jgi:predicted small lipoprotein YifL